MLAKICSGDECFAAKRNVLTSLLSQAIIGFNSLNMQLDNGKWALSPEEEIIMHENALLLIQMLCPENDCGSFILSKIQAHRSLAFIYLERNDIQKGITYLKKAVEDIIAFETSYEETRNHTSLLLRGSKYGKVCMIGDGNLVLDFDKC